jgi:hypothetical protein
MDYQERQAAGACGRISRDFDDYSDLAKLLVFFLPTAIAVKESDQGIQSRVRIHHRVVRKFISPLAWRVKRLGFVF